MVKSVRNGEITRIDFWNLLSRGSAILKDAGIDDSSREALMLLCAAAGCDRAMLISYPSEKFSDEVLDKYFDFLDRRSRREPIQYILGEWEFMGLPFIVSPDVLIPRPDTECIVECVVDALGGSVVRSTQPHMNDSEPLILDLCTGSGCVAISLASFLPNAHIIASDISWQALCLANENAALNHVSERILFVEGDLFQPLETAQKDILLFINNKHDKLNETCTGTLSDKQSFIYKKLNFDVICANPPYISREDLDTLPEDVRSYEPVIALDGGTDGLVFYHRIAKDAARWMKPGGILALEIGALQEHQVEDILRRNNYKKIRTVLDYCGHTRIICAST